MRFTEPPRHGGPVSRPVLPRWLAIGLVGLAGVLAVAGLITEFWPGPSDTSGTSAGAPMPGSLLDGASPIGDGETGAAGSGRVLQDSPVITPSSVPRTGSLPALPGSAKGAKGFKPGTYAPFVPVSVKLPSGTVAGVDKAGVDATGALEVPVDVGRLGWWTGGAEAGDPYGGVVVAGHVDSRTEGIGVMAELRSLHAGQLITLSAGSRHQTYKVKQVSQIPKASLTAKSGLFAQDIAHRLVMITCGGPFDRKTHRYRDNVVLLATPV